MEEQVRQIGRESAEVAALMDSMLEGAPVGLAFVDRELRTLKVNDPFSRYAGLPAQALRGRFVEDVLPPALWRQLAPVFRRVLRTGVPETLDGVATDRPAGEAVDYWRATFYPIRLGGEITGVGVIGMDVTDRRELENAQDRLIHSVVAALASAVEMRDPYTSGHQSTVSLIATAVATDLGFDKRDVETVELAARIHDLGKLRVPSEILTRPGPLSESEMAVVREHAQSGADMLAAVECPEPIWRIVLQHHERLDGSGYPAGLVAGQIDAGARIVAVADVIDAMASPRPYRIGLGIEAALAEIREVRGVLFDEAVVDSCTRLHRRGLLTM